MNIIKNNINKINKNKIKCQIRVYILPRWPTIPSFNLPLQAPPSSSLQPSNSLQLRTLLLLLLSMDEVNNGRREGLFIYPLPFPSLSSLLSTASVTLPLGRAAFFSAGRERYFGGGVVGRDFYPTATPLKKCFQSIQERSRSEHSQPLPKMLR